MSATVLPVSTVESSVTSTTEEPSRYESGFEATSMCLAWLTAIGIMCAVAYLLHQFKQPDQRQLQNWIKISSLCCILSWCILFTTSGVWHTIRFSTNNDLDAQPEILEKFRDAVSVLMYFSGKICLFYTFIARLYFTFKGSAYQSPFRVFILYICLLTWEFGIAVVQVYMRMVDENPVTIGAVASLCSITDIFVGFSVIYIFAKKLMLLMYVLSFSCLFYSFHFF